jgi:transcriptional regulator with GAF, ATPase, and Fis domain
LPAPTLPANGKASLLHVITEIELRDYERKNLLAALVQSRWKVHGPGGAAELLGVKPTTLISRIKKMGLKKSE